MASGRVTLVVLIFVITSISWFVLGNTIVQRTQAGYKNIGPEVQNLWGQPLVQRAPTVVAAEQPVDLEGSDIAVKMDLEYRRRGLLWFAGYVVDFRGNYQIANHSDKAKKFTVDFQFPSPEASYDDFLFTVNDAEQWARTDQGARSTVHIEPGQAAAIAIGYRTRGMHSWSYTFGDGVQRVKDFNLQVQTNFDRYDFPLGSISPSAKEKSGNGWKLTWNFNSLLSGFHIAVAVPQMMNPGDVASRIAFFAPVGLLFFFTVVLVWCLIRRVNLHPMHFVFLSAGFFAFHLLFAYLVDHVTTMQAFLIAAATSLFLVINYIRMVVGIRYALVPFGLAQLVYLILFSYAFFFKGFTGLTIAIGAVLTLAVLMQTTGKVDWEQAFQPRQAAKPDAEAPKVEQV